MAPPAVRCASGTFASSEGSEVDRVFLELREHLDATPVVVRSGGMC